MICFRRIQLIYILMPLSLMVTTSCEQQAKDDPVPAVQEVISMKIPPMKKEQVLVKQSLQAEPALTPVDAISKEKTTVSVTTPPTTEKTTTSVATPTPTASVTVPIAKENSTTITTSVVTPTTTENTTTTPPTATTEESEKSVVLPTDGISGDINEEKLFYIAKDRIDPFEPLIKDKPAATTDKSNETLEEDAPARILTPLEKLDFGQMKLVAILTRESGSVAMVQEATGKGYIVTIGTYIGRNSGQVMSIEKDKLVIQEKVKDHKGNIVDGFHELKLNKPDE